MNYMLGSRTRISVLFTDIAGVPADPTTVVLRVKDPTGNEASYSDWTRSGAGAYYREFDLTIAGTWHYRWIGTGDIQAANETLLNVIPSNFANP